MQHSDAPICGRRSARARHSEGTRLLAARRLQVLLEDEHVVAALPPAPMAPASRPGGPRDAFDLIDLAEHVPLFRARVVRVLEHLLLGQVPAALRGLIASTHRPHIPGIPAHTTDGQIVDTVTES
jgi:hypothetical protein